MKALLKILSLPALALLLLSSHQAEAVGTNYYLTCRSGPGSKIFSGALHDISRKMYGNQEWVTLDMWAKNCNSHNDRVSLMVIINNPRNTRSKYYYLWTNSGGGARLQLPSSYISSNQATRITVVVVDGNTRRSIQTLNSTGIKLGDIRSEGGRKSYNPSIGLPFVSISKPRYKIDRAYYCPSGNKDRVYVRGFTCANISSPTRLRVAAGQSYHMGIEATAQKVSNRESRYLCGSAQAYRFTVRAPDFNPKLPVRFVNQNFKGSKKFDSGSAYYMIGRGSNSQCNN